MAYRDSIQMPMLESIEKDRAWLAQENFHLANSNIVDYFEFRDGHKHPTLRRLDQLALWKQRNIKKLKIHRTTTGQGKDRVRHYTVEFELYDRAAHIHKMAWLSGSTGIPVLLTVKWLTG